ncbi:hypothetical protein Noca_1112 [Nocardioides sp. JS614]|nr:hypothetical protein Noca_1112 [Nocardioides sp. JS614]
MRRGQHGEAEQLGLLQHRGVQGRRHLLLADGDAGQTCAIELPDELDLRVLLCGDAQPRGHQQLVGSEPSPRIGHLAAVRPQHHPAQSLLAGEQGLAEGGHRDEVLDGEQRRHAPNAIPQYLSRPEIDHRVR